jgi:hypothetical protein
MRASPRIYRSYEEFERDELRTLDRLHVTIDEMLDELFSDELDFDPDARRGKRREEEDE